MAFTDTQKSKILFYLGWSGTTLSLESTHYNSVVDDRITFNGDVPTSVVIIADLLENLEEIDGNLKEARV